MKNRTPAAKAGFGCVIYGTAEAVPFLQDRVLTRTLKAVPFKRGVAHRPRRTKGVFQSQVLAHVTHVIGSVHLDLKSVWIIELEGFF